MEITFSDKILKKFTARNYLAITTGTALLFCVVYGLTDTTQAIDSLENPLVTYIFGQFGAIVLMVYVFYFRKSQSKEKGK